MMKFWFSIGSVLVMSLWSHAQEPIPYHKKGTYYYGNDRGKKLSKEKFEDAFPFKDGLGLVMSDGKWGFVNEAAEIEIPLNYTNAWSFKDGAAVVQLGPEHFLINSSGKTITGIYDTIIVLEDYLFVATDERIGILKRSGEILEDLIYEDMGDFYKNKIALKKDGHWGNWSNGIFDAKDHKVYLKYPDTPPVYAMECLLETDPEQIEECSKRSMTDLLRNIRYPPEARANGVEGVVEIRYVINTTGEIEDIEVLQDLGAGCGDQALRIITELMNDWAKPGFHDHEVVNTIKYFPVNFRLN